MDTTLIERRTATLPSPPAPEREAPRPGTDTRAAPGRTLKGQIRELDGLRGIAILLVLLNHFWPPTGPLARFHDLAYLGWIGVDLFFVISGFLITGILLDTAGEAGYYRNFYARRALRIFPLYYLFLAVAFTLQPLAQGGPYFETQFLRESGSPLWYLLYLGNIRAALLGENPAHFLAPLWSLAIEEQFYLTFPLVVAALRRETLRRFLWGLILGAPLFRLAMLLAFPANHHIQYVATLSRMDVLALGCLLALTLRSARSEPNKVAAGVTAAGMLAAMAVAFLLSGLDKKLPFCRVAGYSLIALTFTCVVRWTVLNREQRCTRWLRSAPLGYLGRLCYGLYLLHGPAAFVLARVSDKLRITWDPASPLLMLAQFAVSLLLATLSWYLFERNVLRLKKRFASRNHPTGA